MYHLSQSKLNIFLECPRCFWLEINKGISRPKPYFPSIGSGMDIIIKKYFDDFRERNELPQEIRENIPEAVKLVDEKEVKMMRNWKRFKFIDEKLDVVFSGSLDECLVCKEEDEEFYAPIDFKTRGFPVKEDTSGYYQNQLDCYSLLLEKNKYNHKNTGYLMFYIPKKENEQGLILFDIDIRKVETSSEQALVTLEQAIKTLDSPMPLSGQECNYCNYAAKLNNLN